jgi:hypothetical protein
LFKIGFFSEKLHPELLLLFFGLWFSTILFDKEKIEQCISFFIIFNKIIFTFCLLTNKVIGDIKNGVQDVKKHCKIFSLRNFQSYQQIMFKFLWYNNLKLTWKGLTYKSLFKWIMISEFYNLIRFALELNLLLSII